MDDYIKNIAKKIISEEIDKRIFDIENKIFENKDMKKQMCSECGGKMYEGECMECGSMYEGDIQELGGMDDFKFKVPSPDYDYEEEDEDDYGLDIPDDMPSYKTKYREKLDEDDYEGFTDGRRC